MTFGEAIVKALEAYEVDTVFGIPGVHNLELYRGLSGGKIRHILTRHEQGAGFMAYGYAALSGKPGVCFVISGPGLTNITTPLAHAYADSMPLLVISSDAPSDTLGKGWGYLHEVTDLTAVSKPLTALSVSIKAPDEFATALSKAYGIFSQRPRSVHISIALDVLRQPTNLDTIIVQQAEKPKPDANLIEKAVSLLESSKNPCFVIGGGAVGCGEDIKYLAETFAGSVITTNAGKGILPESHPLSLGTTLTQPSIQEHLSQADVVLAVGTEFADTDSYNHKHSLTGKLIRIDIDKKKLTDLYPAEVAIYADAKLAAKELRQLTPTTKRSAETARLKVAQLKKHILDNVSSLEQLHHRLLTTLRHSLSDDAVVVSDMTQLAYSATFLFPMDKEKCWLHPTGYGSLGFALPVAIGAKIAQPERQVLAIAGDAGFQYTLQELGTAVEHKLGLPILLWNNHGLGEIEISMQAVNIPPTQVHQHNPDFLMLARAYGCDAVIATTKELFVLCIQESFSKDKPTLIEVRQDANWL